MNKYSRLIAIVLGLLIQSGASADLKEDVHHIAREKVKAWTVSPVIVEAIKAQNGAHAGLTEENIKKLDNQWRAETKQTNRPLIEKKLSLPASDFLRKIREESQGLYSEIFVMDNKGLNVAQSDVTSDYWQGDEAKWQKTFLAGSGSAHISDVEMDESTQVFQVQLSLPVVDPADNTVIGAVTVGINVDAL